MNPPPALPTSRATRLMGRAAALAELELALEAAPRSGRLVVVAGAPGVGKTRLVAEWLAGSAPSHVVRWCWPRFATPLLCELSALGLSAHAGAPLAALAVTLAERETGALLVVDGVRDATALLELAEPLWRRCRGLRVVATSVAARTAWPASTPVVMLGPLALPSAQAASMTQLSASEAGAALLAWAEEAGMRWLCEARHAPSLVRLVQLLGGHPLAMELVLARLRPDTLDAWLEHLEGGDDDASPVVARVLSAGAALGDDGLAGLVSRLAPLDGLFGLELAEHLFAARAPDGPLALDVVHALHRARMLCVVREDARTRYALHGAVRDAVAAAPDASACTPLLDALVVGALSEAARRDAARSCAVTHEEAGVAPWPDALLALADPLWRQGATALLDRLLARVGEADGERLRWCARVSACRRGGLGALERVQASPATSAVERGVEALRRGTCAHLAGDLDAADAAFACSHALLTGDAGDRFAAVHAALGRAAVLHERGQLEVAREGYVQVQAALQRCEAHLTLLEVAVLRTLLERAAGRPCEVEAGVVFARSAAALVDEAEAQTRVDLLLRVLAACGGSRVGTSEASGAHPLLERLGAWTVAHCATVSAARAWTVAADGAWFASPGGARVELGRKASARRMLAALLRRRIEAPGEGLGREALFAAGWPGECGVDEKRAANRVHVALNALRKLGLEAVLERVGEGYRLAPQRPIQIEHPRSERSTR